MMTFELPDLGEGLQEAELLEWLVKTGDTVGEDQLVVLVETAKAIVEIPAPAAAIITRLRAAAGDTVKVHQALFDYEIALSEDNEQSDDPPPAESLQRSGKAQQSVSVVGELTSAPDRRENMFEADYYGETSSGCESADLTAIDAEKRPLLKPKADTICLTAFKEAKKSSGRKGQSMASVAPSTMAFARKLGLESLFQETHYRELNLQDLLKIYEEKHQVVVRNDSQGSHLNNTSGPLSDGIPLTGVRKVMAQTMAQSHQQVPAVTLFDDAEISHWSQKEDVTLRVIRAMVSACYTTPVLNAWFEQESMTVKTHSSVHIGLAVNTESGLYVPVLRDCQDKSLKQLREQINHFRKQIQERRLPASDLRGATISLSNFGVLSGRYATPIIVPPQVCILGVGKIHTEAVVKNDKLVAGRILPLSLSFDHRVATGGEAAAFLKSVIEELSQ
jgi:pyruvate dehydrogenase E2 component (dihydrolipoamide acetyltransferase)